MYCEAGHRETKCAGDIGICKNLAALREHLLERKRKDESNRKTNRQGLLGFVNVVFQAFGFEVRRGLKCTLCGPLFWKRQITVIAEDKMEISNGFKERRKHPRFELDLPLEYRVSDMPRGHGGLVVNASESGLLIRSLKHMAVAENIRIVVFFPRGYELDCFEALAEIVHMETYSNDSNVEYRYGLRFVEIGDEDLWKLRQLLCGQPSSKDAVCQNHRREESVQGLQANW